MGEDCKVSVTVGEGALDFMKEESRAGYFRSDKESNLLIATFSGTIDGYEEVNRIQVDNVKAGEWRKIHYDIKRPEPGSETGGVTPQPYRSRHQTRSGSGPRAHRCPENYKRDRKTWNSGPCNRGITSNRRYHELR